MIVSRIVKPIYPAAFERIRDRIAEILKAEIAAQVLITYDISLEDISIVTESINPMDKSNLPVINVSFAAATYADKDYSGQSMIRATPYVYNIDVYTNAKTSVAQSGDYSSAKLQQKILGICRYILEDPQWKTLGYDVAPKCQPFIERVYCSEINIASWGRNDAENSIFGRITFNVVATETNALEDVPIIQGQTTVFNLANSNNNGFTTVTV